MADYLFRRVYLSPRFLIGKIREKGLLGFLKAGALTFAQPAVNFFMISVFKYPLYYLRVRFLSGYISYVGHLAHDTNCYVKGDILGMRPRYFTILLAQPGEAANPHLLDYWKKYLTIISSPLASVEISYSNTPSFLVTIQRKLA